MNKREQSRAAWEQETREVQQNITPAEAPWAARYMAKKGSTAPLEDLTHFVKLLSAGTLVTLGISALLSGIPYSSAFAVAALAAGCYLGWSGFRWDHTADK
jgi:hypothetical protein